MNIKYLCLQATQEGQASYAHVYEIIKGLEKRGWDVEFFEPKYARNEKLPGPFGRLMEFLLVQIQMCKKVNKNDIIYIRSHFAAFPISLLARLLHIPVVQEVNGPYEDLFIAWPWTRNFAILFKWLFKVQLRWADAIIAVTPQLKDWVIKETGNKPVFVIPNGANTELFTPEATSIFELPEYYVVFFGALAQWQGIDTILNAVKLPAWPTNLKLVIIGDGVERLNVEKAAKENSNIIYLGKIPYHDVPGIVAHSIAGLSPKNNKGNRSNTGLFPLKLFETLACGVPVIVTDFPGQADLVRKYNCGIVIPPDNPEELAKAVSFLYNNPIIRKEMGIRGNEAINKEHSWDKRAEDTEVVLMKLKKGEVK